MRSVCVCVRVCVRLCVWTKYVYSVQHSCFNLRFLSQLVIVSGRFQPMACHGWTGTNNEKLGGGLEDMGEFHHPLLGCRDMLVTRYCGIR